MKSKLLIFFGLAILSVSLVSSTVSTTPAYALVCGDPGFIGPCANYATMDCAAQTDVNGRQSCIAIKACISPSGGKKTVQNCSKGWSSCVASYGTNTVDYANCVKFVSIGDFAKAVAPPASETEKTTCAIDGGLGWIICPLLRTTANIVDESHDAVSTLLTVPAIDTTTGGSMYKAWSLMRNFANITFVMAFMVVIYSQLTGVGVTNYGIKKLLPRIIIAAILVNVSFWVCAAAVDISNIVGTSLYNLLEGVNSQLFDPGQQSGTGQGKLAGIIAGILATGVGLWAGLSVAGPILIGALAAIVTAVLVLTLRQALIVILIVISPLAFVAYLLPNTSGWFTKWKDLGVTLLLMFPIISIVFAGSQVASTVISNAAQSSGHNVFLQAMAAGVQIIPLFITPILMKAGGGLLNRWGGIVNDPAKGVFDRGKRRAEDYKTYRGNVRKGAALSGSRRVFGGNQFRRASKREAIRKGAEGEANKAQTSYVANEAVGNEEFRNKLAGGGKFNRATPEALNSALANAVSVQAKIEAEEVNAASAVIKDLGLNREQMRELANGGQTNGLNGGSSRAVRAAAMQNVVNSHDVDGVNSLLDDVGTMDAKTRESLADSLQNSSQRPGYVGQAAIENIRQHGNDDGTGTGTIVTAMNSTELAATAIDNNTYSVDKIANGDREELEFMAAIAANPSVPTNNTQFADNATKAMTDTKYSGQIAKNARVVDIISRL